MPEALIKAYKLNIPLCNKLDTLTTEELEILIGGENEDSEGGESFAWNQEVATIEYVKIEGGVLYVAPLWCDETFKDATVTQERLQNAFYEWCGK